MTLRQRLAEAKIALRAAKDTLKTAETVATLGVTGKNPEERKANTAIALHDDRPYTLALTHVRVCEATLERAEADIAEEEHELRLREVTARERLAEALMGKRVDDGVVDTTLRDALYDCAERFFALAEDMGCGAGNHDGGSSADCEHCQLVGHANHIERLLKHQTDGATSDHMSNGNLESHYYAGKRRPQPTYQYQPRPLVDDCESPW